jgi:hypothetical protein
MPATYRSHWVTLLVGRAIDADAVSFSSVGPNDARQPAPAQCAERGFAATGKPRLTRLP